MKDFIEFVTRHLVDHPEKIAVSEEQRDGKTIFWLTVDPTDLGKVIGKKGRIAFAMRILINAIGKRTGCAASFEIFDGQPKTDGELTEK